MKKILLIPTYYYLSNPVYSSIYYLLKNDFKFSYLFTKDSTLIKENLDNISYEKIGYIFDEYFELDINAPWIDRIHKEKKINKVLTSKSIATYVIRKVKNYFYMIVTVYNIRCYVKKIINIIKDISPDIIIITSDMTISYRIIKKYFPNLSIVIIQPCFLDFRKRELKNYTFINKIRNFIVGNILYPKQPYFGMENQNDKLLLFENKFLDFYKDKREKVYQILNPFYCKLNKDVINLKISKKKNKLLNKLKINNSNKTIIIFLADYTSIHGADIQLYIEKTYIQIIKNFHNKYNFILKNHPRIEIKNFKDNFLEISNVCVIKNELDNKEVLSLGDLNISINSNASLEALVCGMPTINFLPLNLIEDDNFKWLSFYGGIEISTFGEMEVVLNTFIENETSYINQVKKGQMKLIGNNSLKCKKILRDILLNV